MRLNKIFIMIAFLFLFSGCVVKDAVMLPVDIVTTTVSVGTSIGGAVVDVATSSDEE